MLFRTPTDEAAANPDFYENEYSEGFTTELPSQSRLDELKRTNFVGTEKDYSYYISVLFQLGLNRGARLFDYGCSWGYGSYQLARAGFGVTAFEVGPSRRRYARNNLDVQTIDDMDNAVVDLAGHFDCFFSAHVLEHVPSPQLAFDAALRLLRSGGLFVCFAPNGSDTFRSAQNGWSRLWGEVHPNFVDDTFLNFSFKRSPRCIGSSPVVNALIPSGPEITRLDGLTQSELFFAAQKDGNSWT